MKRRKPILEFRNPRDPPFHVSSSTNEIQSLVSYSEDSDSETNITNSETILTSKPTTPWRACVDENTGYSYYWNVETNQVTWEVPAEYLAYESLVQQWETQQAKNTAKYEELSEIQQKSERKELDSANQNSSSDSDSSIKEEKIELITAYGPSSDDSDSEKKNSRKVNSKYHEIGSIKNNPLYNGKSIQLSNPSSPKLASVTSFLASLESTMDSTYTNSQLNHKSNERSFSQNSDQPIKEITEMKDSAKSHSNSGSPFHITEDPPSNINQALKLSTMVDHDKSDNSSSDSDENEDDEELDDVIISRLRKKATLLKQLGGEVPKEILSVFDSSKTAEDIIAEIEKEIPPDQTENDSFIFKQPKIPEIPNKISEEKRSEVPAVKPLFPIMDYMKKEETQVEMKAPTKVFSNQKNKMKNIQKIKLSARAKELIRTSLLTAKARATNFVETEDGLKPAEEVHKLETKGNNTENASETGKSRLDLDEAAELEDFTPLPKKPADAPSVIEDLELKKSAPAANYFNLPDIPKIKEEKKVLGFGTTVEETTIRRSDMNIVNSDTSNDGKYDFQKSFMVYYPKDKKSDGSKKSDDINASLWSKCEEFLKTEINRPDDIASVGKENDKESSKKNDDRSKIKGKHAKECKKTFNDIDIDEVLNTKDENEDKKMTDLSQLIMEKLKFLSEGKGQVAAVQVMAIQIETLVGAWQSGALNLKYLSEWLDASLVQLKSIEESAAPSGWHCEWDRSYGRYYYRNKVTGSIQWDFPEDDSRKTSSRSLKRSSSKKSSHSRPRTPPPPIISDMVPPPPPMISDRDRDRDRKRRPSPRRDSGKRRRNDESSRSSRSRHRRSRSPPSTPVLPPLPTIPPKPATPPPPPPPSSPPPPPPPPPTISSGGELGSKPQLAESNYTDACTTVTPMEIENDDEEPVKLHDELDSFYSDIASIEAKFTQGSKIEETAAKTEETPVSAPKPPVIVDASVNQDKPVKLEERVFKKKKKVKLDSGLSLKKKGLEGLVAKWQKVNSDI